MDGLDSMFIVHVCLVILSLFLCIFNMIVSTMNLNRVEDHIDKLLHRISILETDFYGGEEEPIVESDETKEINETSEEEIKED